MKSATAPCVLIVDDEESIRTLVQYTFEREGFQTFQVADGLDALDLIRSHTERYDLVILDVMLPGQDGMEVCKQLRRENVSIPVILLTAKDDEVDKVVGLEIGADDYVTKPFSPRELVARAKAVLRRFGSESSSASRSEQPLKKLLVVGDVQMDMDRHEASVSGQLMELTPREFELLQYFMENSGRVLTRDQLLDHIWGFSAVRDTRIVDVHVSHLREKLEGNPKHPNCIRTVRGIGYKFSGISGRS
jgi:two-component system, OmpR family, alkaline phosphatase synthesis response regulator PhoP